jgi:maleylacetate reductase
MDSVSRDSPPPDIDYRGLPALGALLRDANRRRVFLISGAGRRHVAAAMAALPAFEVIGFADARRHVPLDVVERATQAFDSFGADAVVSIGGGSATGLGKALRLRRSFFFVAVPTTYAASELTNLYGITSAAGKQTGRDARVVPDVALYDVELTREMPLGTSVTSLLNALAHPVSALSTGKLSGAPFERALDAARGVYRALQGLVVDPRSAVSRRAALEGAVLAGRVLCESPLGVHHKLAHLLGGRFDLEHAELHGVLLPHSVAFMRRDAAGVHGALEARLGDTELERTLFDFLGRALVPTSLSSMGLAEAAFRLWLATEPELPRELLEAAFVGARP